MSIKIHTFLTVWSGLWTLGQPVVRGYLHWRGRKDPDYSKNIRERLGYYDAHIKPSIGAVWLHAVSLGEVNSIIPLVNRLLDQGERILITNFTPAGRREAYRAFAAEIAKGQVVVTWVPFETNRAWQRFFAQFRPVYGLAMEVEVWPQMVFSARKAKVPLFICNAQYPHDSIMRDSRDPLKLRQSVIRGFSGALVKSEVQAQRFLNVGVKNIAITGELRFDRNLPSTLIQKGLNARKYLTQGHKERAIIAIASSIEGEEAIYIQAIQRLRQRTMTAGQVPPLFVYIPRRPERFDEVNNSLKKAGLSVHRRSDVFSAELEFKAGKMERMDVLLGNSMGEMYFYLSMADKVVVGGGFNPRGAHNIIEPFSLGKPVVTGPYTQTIEYPFEEAKRAGVALSVPSAEALEAVLAGDFNPGPDDIERFLTEHSGATEKTLAAIPDLLKIARAEQG